MLPQNETAAFFHAIYGEDVPGWLPMFTLPNKTTAWVQATNLDGAERLALAASKAGQNVYVPVGLQGERLRSGRGTTATVCALAGMWADVDIAGPAHADGRLPPSDADALTLVEELPLAPTVVVHSGHGLQVWWLFRELWTLDTDGERKEAATLARRWQTTVLAYAARHGWTVDAPPDLARILRVPGTVNRKPRCEPVPVRLLSIAEDARYTREDFETYLVDEPATAGDSDNGREPADLLVEVPLAAQALTLLKLERRDTYNPWLDVGFALSELGDAGLALWEAWSKPSPHYQPGICAAKWTTMEPGKGITLASLHHWAAEDEGVTLTKHHHAPISSEPHTLAQVVETYQHHMYMPDAGHLVFDLSTIIANRFAGDAVWGLTVGPPGSGKTETMSGLAAMPDVFPVATLTVASLLSGTSKRDKVAGAKGGLLREIGDFGILAIKDFGGILSMNRDARAELLAALREIFDGSWTRYVGTDGGKCLSWSGKVGLIGCATPAIDHAHSVMGTLGERFVFYRVPEDKVPERAGAALKHSGNEIAMRADIAEAVHGLMDTIEMPPVFEPIDPESKLGEWLIALASLAARCRSVVIRDGYRREVELIPGAEVPTRLVIVLAKLYRAAQIIGVSEMDARKMVHKVAFDSMPQLRRRVLALLLNHPDGRPTKFLAHTLGTPTNTTKVALEDLTCYQVLVREGSGPPTPDLWKPSHQTLLDHQTIAAFLRNVDRGND